MGRKSRSKREPHARESAAPVTGELANAELSGRVEDVAVALDADRSIALPPRRRRPKKLPVGARVARVAVDDATWAAFRELCGDMPASIRLGELVEADVQRAFVATPESEAVAALRAIRMHADQLEAFIRDDQTTS
jgi:hypothetical protein